MRSDPADPSDVSEASDPCTDEGSTGGGDAVEPDAVGDGRGRRLLVEAALLATLAEQRRAHGYDLRKLLTDLTGGFVHVDSGNLYRLLRRLEQDGLVTSSWTEGEHGPQRREYRLTHEGSERLHSWRTPLEKRERAFRAVIDAIDRSAAVLP